MRKILRWLGIRGGIALLLGAVVTALTGSVVFGAVATGIVVLVAVNVAAFLYLDRGIAPRGGVANGAPHVGARAASWAREPGTASAWAASMAGAAAVTAAGAGAADESPRSDRSFNA